MYQFVSIIINNLRSTMKGFITLFIYIKIKINIRMNLIIILGFRNCFVNKMKM